MAAEASSPCKFNAFSARFGGHQKRDINHDPVDFTAQSLKNYGCKMGIQTLAASLLAASLLTAAAATPADANHWLGLPGTENGFLIDTETGAVWMTGGCLAPLETAVKTGQNWVSRTPHWVSAGRAMTLLDQRFELTLDSANPRFVVEETGRGGRQEFTAELIDCAASNRCDGFAAQPVCES